MELTPEELNRLVQFFELLMEWDQREKRKARLRHDLVVVLALIRDNQINRTAH